MLWKLYATDICFTFHFIPLWFCFVDSWFSISNSFLEHSPPLLTLHSRLVRFNFVSLQNGVLFTVNLQTVDTNIVIFFMSQKSIFLEAKIQNHNYYYIVFPQKSQLFIFTINNTIIFNYIIAINISLLRKE